MDRPKWLDISPNILHGTYFHAGIGRGTYRTYPVRAGESIKDIISKRNITRAEVDALNPEVNLDKLACKLL